MMIVAAPVSAFAEGETISVNHANDKNWRDTVTRITKLSAQQNGGKPDIAGPTCYAEDNEAFCATAVWYVTPEGKNAFVRVVRDGATQTKVVFRDVCRFNKEMTKRYCTDFDSGTKSEYEKINGDWKQLLGEFQGGGKDAGGGI